MKKSRYCHLTVPLICLFTLLQSCKKNELSQQPSQPFQKDAAVKSINLANDNNSIEPNAIQWSLMQGQPKATHEVHGQVVNNKLYIFGGFDVNKRPSAWVPTKRAYVYDPLTNKWASIKSLPHTPNGSDFGGVTHMGVATDGTDIYIAGGYTANSTGTGQVFGTKQVYKYLVASNIYSPLPNLPEPLAAGKLEYLNGLLHYMGGANLKRQDVTVHYVLNLNNLTAGWQTAAPLLDALNHPGSTVLNGKIYFMGGAHHQDEDTQTQSEMHVYDPATNAWQRLANMPIGVDHISSSVITMGNRILVLGGETAHNVLSKKVMVYNPQTNSWTELTPLPSARSAGVAAILNGNIYYTGGNFSNINRKGIPVTEIMPTADAFVRSGTFATTNFGADTNLTVKATTNASFNRKAYLKFSLAGIGNFASAKLRLYGYNADNTTPIMLYGYGVADDSWTEGTINFNNAPASMAPALGSVLVNNTPAYIEMDVTDYVRSQSSGDTTTSFVIKDANNKNTTLQFNSKEGRQNKPALVFLKE
jgi:N-acetylneuraminic acid mutarotase